MAIATDISSAPRLTLLSMGAASGKRPGTAMRLVRKLA
jgi:hypothetical protein